jgi:hypothetical protein
MSTETPAAPTTSGVVQQDGGTLRVIPGTTEAAAAAAQANAESVSGGTPPPAPPAAERPEGLPEGYDSYEAFSKAVLDGTYKPGEAPAPADGEAPEVAANDPRLAPYTTELTENGSLSDESVAKAAAEFGVSEDMVRAYVKGLTTEADSSTAELNAAASELASLAGGREGYADFTKWAEEGGMTPEQTTVYNKALDGDKDVAKALLATHVANWKAAGFGPAPTDLTQGQGGGAPLGGDAAGGYESWAQVKVDMNDPRYTGTGGKQDPAFIKAVEAKLGRSPALD